MHHKRGETEAPFKTTNRSVCAASQGPGFPLPWPDSSARFTMSMKLGVESTWPGFLPPAFLFIFLSSMSRATYCFDPFLSRDDHREARARCPPCGLPRGDIPAPTPHCPDLRPEDVVPGSRIRIWLCTGMFASVCM